MDAKFLTVSQVDNPVAAWRLNGESMNKKMFANMHGKLHNIITSKFLSAPPKKTIKSLVAKMSTDSVNHQ